MKKTIKDYLNKTFSVRNITSRFFQIGVAFIASFVAFMLAETYSQSDLAQGFYSGAVFIFFIERLDKIFIK